MSEAKHTPGPWHVNGDCWVGFDRNNAEAGGYQFCAVAHVMERIGSLDANASLIAAAPELLQACKGAIPVLECAIEAGIEDNPDLVAHAMKNHATLNALRDAAAKAELRKRPI